MNKQKKEKNEKISIFIIILFLLLYFSDCMLIYKEKRFIEKSIYIHLEERKFITDVLYVANN